MLKVLCSIDGTVLEEALLERVRERHQGGLTDGLLVIVPTRRLATYLKKQVASSVPAALGVHILTHRGLAVRSLECAFEVAPRVLPGAVLTTLLETLVATEEESPDQEYLTRWPGVRAAVLATFRELREAGIQPAQLEELTDVLEYVRRLYGRFHLALEALQSQGLSDRAGLVRAALPHVSRFLELKGIRRAVHYGAYELVGVHLELLETVEAAVETVLLLPSELEGEAFHYAARFAQLLRRRGATIEPAPERGRERDGWLERLRRLYEEGASGSPVAFDGFPRLEIQHVQGAQSEVEVALLRALSLHNRERIPLHEIAIVARSLEPYAPFVEATCETLGVPYSTSLTVPLKRDPVVGSFLALLGALVGDLPRGKVIDLFRRPALRLGEGIEEDRWDRWSRSARVVSGLQSWKELRSWLGTLDRPGSSDEGDDSGGTAPAEDRTASLDRLLSILDRLDSCRAAWEQARSFSDHAQFLRELAQEYLILPAPHPGIESLLGSLEQAEAAREAAQRTGSRSHDAAPGVSPSEIVALLDAVATREELQVGPDDERGVRILDVMQARGLSHRVVIWIGFHDGSFPRKARPDPYLPDRAREELSEATGRPVPLKVEAAGEERLLLATTLAATRERLVVSFQRADESGRRRARSSALREVARAFTGRPDARALLAAHEDTPWRPHRVSAHPAERAHELAASSSWIGLLPPAEAAVAAAIRAADGPRAARHVLLELGLGEASPLAALDAVAALERFEAPLGELDGRTGKGISRDAVLSPTALERLARCPLSFFLQHVLLLRELDEEVLAHRLEKRVLGVAVHEVLQDIYCRLDSEGILGRSEASTKRALEVLPDSWRAHVRKAAGSSYDRLRGLFDLLGERWLPSIEEFLRADLDACAERGVTGIELEEEYEASLSLAPRLRVNVKGRIDRVLRSSEEARVDDYKTGGRIKDKAAPANVLRGLHLQLPVYHELVAARLAKGSGEVRARLVGVGPDAEAGEAELAWTPPLREGVLETLAIALRLARSGIFPLHPDLLSEVKGAAYCSWCGYRRACRRTHEPSVRRLRNDPAVADYLDVWRKENKDGRRTLADLRANDLTAAEADRREGGDS